MAILLFLGLQEHTTRSPISFLDLFGNYLPHDTFEACSQAHFDLWTSLEGKDFIFPQFQVSSPSPSTSLAQLRDVAKETPRSLWLSYQLSTASPCTEQNTKMSFLFTLPYCKADTRGTDEGSWRNSLGLATVISPDLFPG